MFFPITALILFSFSFLHSGIADTTAVQTLTGQKQIKVLKIGDKLLCTNMDTLGFEEASVKSIEEIEVTDAIQITTEDGVSFCVAPDQKLFLSYKWVEAKDLTMNDCLLTRDRKLVKIVSLCQIEEPVTLKFITVDKHSNFLAAENGVLVHNGPICGAITYVGIKAGAYIGICVASTVAVASAAGTLPVTIAGAGVAGSCATAAISVAAPVGTTATIIGAGAMGTATVSGTVVASTIQSVGILAATTAAIESAAVSASLWVGVCPLLP